MSANDESTVSKVSKVIEPISHRLGFTLWDVEFVKEGKDYFLRVYIDKDDGVSIDDCEKMSRAIDEPLDALDPINHPYCLEVSSPGVERNLRKPFHFLKFIGNEIKVKFIRPYEGGQREIIAKLLNYEKNTISIELDGQIRQVKLKDTVYVKLNDF